MRRVVYLLDAQDNLKEIHRFLLRETSSRKIATGFVKQLKGRCERISRYKAMIGRPRDDLAPGLRGITHKSYAIFFRYGSDRIEIVNVLHGHRDLGAYFERKSWGIET